MRLVRADLIYQDNDGKSGFRLTDGRIITEFDGCAPNQNCADIIKNLADKLQPGDELVEIDKTDSTWCSDATWYGILKEKVNVDHN